MNSQTTNHPPTSTVTHPSCSAVSGNVPDSVPASSTVSSNDRNFHFIVRNADDGDVVDSILRALTKDYPKFRFWIGTGGIDCSTTVRSSTSASVRKDIEEENVQSKGISALCQASTKRPRTTKKILICRLGPSCPLSLSSW